MKRKEKKRKEKKMHTRLYQLATIVAITFIFVTIVKQSHMQGMHRVREEIQKNAFVVDRLLFDQQLLLLDNLQFLLAPQWPITILGEEYTVRLSTRNESTSMFIMTTYNSQELDQNIYQILDETNIGLHPDETTRKMDIIKDNMRKDIYTISRAILQK